MSKSDEIEDFLTEDPEISSQKIVLLSFLSPEKVLAKKDLYFFREFMKDYELSWKTSKFEQWFAERIRGINEKLEKLAGSLELKDLSGVSHEIRTNELRVDRLMEDFEEYRRKNKKELTQTNIQSEYDDFMFKNEKRLEDEYHKMNDFHTTIRGIKVRGVYSTEAEAAARAKRLQKSDPNFNIYMGAVGKWMAWDPNPNNVTEQEYANEQLNTLMKKYRDNEEARDVFYTEQKKKKIGQAKAKAVEDSEESSASNVAAAGGGGSFAPSSEGSEQYSGLFDGTPDLAIARKMENKQKEN
jgi:hypothetical protein